MHASKVFVSRSVFIFYYPSFFILVKIPILQFLSRPFSEIYKVMKKIRKFSGCSKTCGTTNLFHSGIIAASMQLFVCFIGCFKSFGVVANSRHGFLNGVRIGFFGVQFYGQFFGFHIPRSF